MREQSYAEKLVAACKATADAAATANLLASFTEEHDGGQSHRTASAALKAAIEALRAAMAMADDVADAAPRKG